MQLSSGSPVDLGVVTIIIQLIFLEGILSIDNAAVLGAMVSILPDDRPVPYPRPVKFLQPFTNRVFGMQRMAALKVGLLGAYLGRGLMLFLASYVIQNPWLRLVGAFYLIKLAFDHLPTYAFGGPHDARQDSVVGAAVSTTAFWLVVFQVELADLAFSLDNVVAAVALSDELWVVLTGVALGIVTMRFAAGIFTHLIEREPILAPAAYVLVLNIGIELILEDFHLYEFNQWAKFAISLTTLLLALLYAHSKLLQRTIGPGLHWIARGMMLLDDVIGIILWPISRVMKPVLSGLSALARSFMTSGTSRPADNPAIPSPNPSSAHGNPRPKGGSSD